MDFNLEIFIVAKILASLALGSIIGFDRERHGKNAGIRTYAAVSVGSTIFTSVAAHMLTDPSAASRIVANVVTGVGFLGAGIIYSDQKGTSRGLTTAATVWCTAAVGIAVGLDMFIIAVAATGVLYALLTMHHQDWYIRWKKRISDGEIHTED